MANSVVDIGNAVTPRDVCCFYELNACDGSESFGCLQIKRNSFSIDQHGAAINQLLAGAIILFVTAEKREGEKELNGLRVAVTSRAS
jgi:hypothetical protein